MRIVFLGDSVTEGGFEIIEKADGSFDGAKDTEAVYVTLLEKRLKSRFPDMQIEIINAGIGGNTSIDGLSRLEADVITKGPDIAVVSFGLNDVGATPLEKFESNLCSIFKRLNESEIKAVFMTPNMTTTHEQSFNDETLNAVAKACARLQTDGTMDLFVQTARNCAKAYDVALCDAYAFWKRLYEYGVNTDELLSNRINHPTRAMHKLFADLLEPILTNMIF